MFLTVSLKYMNPHPVHLILPGRQTRGGQKRIDFQKRLGYNKNTDKSIEEKIMQKHRTRRVTSYGMECKMDQTGRGYR